MNQLRSLARMLGWLGGYPVRSGLVGATLLFEMAFAAATPLAVRALIDQALVPRDARPLVLVVAFFVVGAVVTSLVGLAGDFLFAQMATAILNELRRRMLEHLQRLSTSYYATRSIADVTSRFSIDMAAVKASFDILISWGLLPALDVVVNTVLLFVLDWRLAAVAQLVWPASFVGPKLLAGRTAAAAGRLKDDEAAVLADVQEIAGGQSVIRAFGLEDGVRSRFRSRLGGLRRLELLTRLLTTTVDRSVTAGVLVVEGAMLGVGGALVLEGKCTIGTLVAFQAILVSLSYSIGYVVRFFGSHVHATAGLDRIEALLAEAPVAADPPGAAALPPIAESIVFEHVGFGYGDARDALDDVSLRVRRGEWVAIVGPSGSGKTTLLGMLLRFHEPARGAVRVDGRDVRQATRRSLTDQIGVVFQETFLFNASIRENIRLGRVDATDDEIVEAARRAELHDFIAQLPDGYDTNVGERGARLSGGQRQRVAIARVFLRDPPILLMDEATSALDLATEAAVNGTIDRVRVARTLVTATHRLGSIVGADRIYVLSAGRVVEQGRHEDLLALRGEYARLWESRGRAGAAAAGPPPAGAEAAALLSSADAAEPAGAS